jgi:hypothetical protein
MDMEVLMTTVRLQNTKLFLFEVYLLMCALRLELDYIFNALVLRLESSSPIASQPHQLVVYILDVIWPDLGVELLMHRRRGITKEEAKEILKNDSRYEWSRIESNFQ